MAIWVRNDRAPTPWGGLRRRDDGGWIIPDSSDHSLKRWNDEANASVKSRSAIRGLWIQLEDAAAKFSRQVLRAAAMLMTGELQTQTFIETPGTL
jgi:hypothetical protein